MVVKQMQQRRRREDWAGATSGWEERAPPDPRRWRTPAVRTSWRDGCTAAAIAKVPDIICMARRAKLTIYLKPKEIHDKCGTINTCKIDTKTKLGGGGDCIYQGLFYNLHNIQSSLPKNDRSAKSSLRPFCNILKKSDGTVGMPILRSRRVPPSEMMVIGDEGDP
uniref:Uncharacterized protein n=2 Tax=Oryza nivara TaxID=4536 RepID=A0A0E0IS77_ORYNI